MGEHTDAHYVPVDWDCLLSGLADPAWCCTMLPQIHAQQAYVRSRIMPVFMSLQMCVTRML